jgi:hypothetical protein
VRAGGGGVPQAGNGESLVGGSPECGALGQVMVIYRPVVGSLEWTGWFLGPLC